MNTIKNGIAFILLSAISVSGFAQQGEWEPIGVWPFIFKSFKPATVHIGLFSKKETVIPCNIHVGKNALWFAKDGETLMEAIPDNVRKVVFKDGSTYMPIGANNKFGEVIFEGELQGQTARVFLLKEVNQAAVDQQYVDYLNKTQNMLQGGGGAFFGHLADGAGQNPENTPVPLKTTFYFLFKGELFEATTKNILAHIDPERKKEYKAYTRSAEVLSTSKVSMLKVWNDFFVNYQKSNQ